jgi:hypothetical protein
MIIDPIRAKRIAKKLSAKLAHERLLKEFSISNRKAATFPENPQYQERIKLSETEIKTLNDVLMEIRFPNTHVVTKTEEVGPECTQLASYMQAKISSSAINNSRALRDKSEKSGCGGHKSTKQELRKYLREMRKQLNIKPREKK